ncbi:MAG: zinc ribbon domain-containing protein [Opitutaceae bacterium]
MPDRGAAPAECAQCGAEIPPRSHACPECGADERTGWRESSIYDGLDLPDTAHDNARPAARRSAGPGGLAWHWWITGVILLLAFAAVLIPFR